MGNEDGVERSMILRRLFHVSDGISAIDGFNDCVAQTVADEPVKSLAVLLITLCNQYSQVVRTE